MLSSPTVEGLVVSPDSSPELDLSDDVEVLLPNISWESLPPCDLSLESFSSFLPLCDLSLDVLSDNDLSLLVLDVVSSSIKVPFPKSPFAQEKDLI